MDWYVNRNGQAVGPCDDATVIGMIRNGELIGGSVCPVGSQQWVDLASHAPFAEALRGAAPPPPPPPPEQMSAASSSPGEALGYTILLLPLATTVLIWVWVGSMNLLQDPATTLTMLGFATILATTVLISVEASQLGMGKAAVEKGKRGNGPIAWFIGILVMWIVMFPWYLAKRRWYGKKNLVVGGVFVALVFLGSWVGMGTAIEQKKAEIRSQLQGIDLPALNEVAAPALQAAEPVRRAGVTMTQFEELQTGMSYEQACKVLGAEGEVITSNDLMGIKTVMYKWNGTTLTGNMNAMFQNDKLIQKSQFGLQ